MASFIYARLHEGIIVPQFIGLTSNTSTTESLFRRCIRTGFLLISVFILLKSSPKVKADCW